MISFLFHFFVISRSVLIDGMVCNALGGRGILQYFCQLIGNGGDSGEAKYLAEDIFHNGFRFNPHIRCKHLIALKDEKVGEGYRAHDDILVRDAELLFGGKCIPSALLFSFFMNYFL